MPQKKIKTTRYEQAVNNLIYYMLKDNRVIAQSEKEIVYIIDNNLKILFNEIIYFYHKYGTFIIADFFTHISDKEEILKSLERITSMKLKETYTEEEIKDYIKVINEEVKEIKIKSLEQKLKEETDPMVQLKILNEIANIKGVNNNDRPN